MPIISTRIQARPKWARASARAPSTLSYQHDAGEEKSAMKHSWPRPLLQLGGFCALALVVLAGPAAAQPREIQISVVDGNFNSLSALPIGETLFVGVSGLVPDR